MKRKIFVISCVLGLGTLATPAMADVFRCVAPEGDVTYSDEPCDDNTVASANLTEAVRSCDTPECEAALQQSREQSLVRLREERAALAQMQEMRLRAEAHELDRQLKLAQLERLESLDDREQVVGGGGIWWPAYPLHPDAGKPGRPGKPGTGSGSHPKPRPKQGGVSFR